MSASLRRPAQLVSVYRPRAGTRTSVHTPLAATVAPFDAVSQGWWRTRIATVPLSVASNVIAVADWLTSVAGGATIGCGSAIAYSLQCASVQISDRYGG